MRGFANLARSLAMHLCAGLTTMPGAQTYWTRLEMGSQENAEREATWCNGSCSCFLMGEGA